MLKIIRNILKQFIDDIDSRNTYISENEQLEVIQLIQKITSQDLSKIEAAEYIGVSRATFDNYIKEGKIPKGNKRPEFKELSWKKSDLNKFLEENA